jgi:ketosteroid isomerase-like protein
MMTEKVSNELLSLEKKYWNAIKNRDVAAAKRLSTDPCVVVGAPGCRRGRPQGARRHAGKATYDLTDYRFDDVKVRQVADDVAVVAYKVKEKLVVDGKDVTLDAFDSSVWCQRDGQWLCALAHRELGGRPLRAKLACRRRDGRPVRVSVRSKLRARIPSPGEVLGYEADSPASFFSSARWSARTPAPWAALSLPRSPARALSWPSRCRPCPCRCRSACGG